MAACAAVDSGLHRTDAGREEAACGADSHEFDLSRWEAQIGNGCEGLFGGRRVPMDPQVFPAPLGATSRDIALALQELQHEYEKAGLQGPKVTLDMGCGDASLALTLGGMDTVEKAIAVDNNPAAVEAARGNAAESRYADKVEVYESDLLRGIEGRLPLLTGRDPAAFDLIVFNHPYYPREGEPRFGLGADAGAPLIRRFFEEIAPYVHDRTEIIMPYSSDVPPEHNPAEIAKEFGYQVQLIRVRYDNDGERHCVFRFVKDDVFQGQFPKSVIRERRSAAAPEVAVGLAA